jgi:predicted signal transduction protein with EAL and GGDEF domain
MWRWVRVRGTTARDATGNVMCLAGSMADITATKVADSLTGLPNRLHFLEHLSLAIETSNGSGAWPCVLFVDLDADPIAQRILDALAAPFVLVDRHLHPASIGIATWNPAYRTPYDLLRDADTAMYRAKQAGKNRYEVFEDAHRTQSVHRLNFENELRRAVGGREFSLAWQPTVDLATGGVEAVKVLLRWPGFHRRVPSGGSDPSGRGDRAHPRTGVLGAR